MHYKSGTEAQLGDLVIGTGYNVKDDKGEPAVLVGTVIGLVPDSEACNIRVAHAVATEVKGGVPDHRFFLQKPGIYLNTESDCSPFAVAAGLEYGQADAFELLHRPGVGDLKTVMAAIAELPPAPAAV